MTLRTRNTLFLLAAILSLFMALLFVTIMGEILINNDESLSTGLPLWEISIWPPFPDVFYGSAVFLFLLSSAAAVFTFRFLFRRSISSEIFFIILFIFSISFESFRGFHAFILGREIPQYYGVILVRFLYAGYFLGLFGLFAASFFSAHGEYQKLGIILLFIYSVSFGLAFFIPLNTSEVSEGWLYLPINMGILLLMIISVSVLTLANYIRNLSKGPVKSFAVFLSIFCLLLGRTLTFFFTDAELYILGLGFFVFGTVYYGKSKYLVALW